MTFRRCIFVLVAGAMLVPSDETMAQESPFAQRLEGTVTQVETSTLSDSRNAELRTALESKRDLAAKSVEVRRPQMFDRVLGRPESSVVRIAVRFTELPQRAMAPVLLANGQIIGHAVGPAKEVGNGVEVEFLVLPQLAGNFRINLDEPIELSVQMGEDPRTKSVLRSDQAANTLREAFTK